MELSLNEIIRSANLLYGKLYVDSKDYKNALDYYRRSLEILFKIKQSQTGPKQEQTVNVIKNLLEKAEYCKSKLDMRQPSPRPNGSSSKYTQAIGRGLVSNRFNNASPRAQEKNPYEISIEQEIVDRSPRISWDSISGLSQAKEIIQEAVIKPMLYPKIYTGLRAPPKGILLFGPPGTGKTLLAKAVASQCNATFLNVSSASLTSKNYGDAEKLVRALFSVATKYQPSVIFIDEVDSILGARGDGQHEASRRLETEFLVQMDGVGSNSEDRVLLIAATNRPQELDEAVRRRLTKRIYIPLPDAATRESLIRNLLNGNSNISNKEIKKIVNSTDGFSGSDLAALCKEAALDSVRGLSDRQLNSGIVPPIVFQNFSKAINVIRPSVPKSSLLMYERWNQEYGVR
jgi:SpoVK/Ycf46/Vps4 family AAA+-type ATPase